jgi:hypothetical protein
MKVIVNKDSKFLVANNEHKNFTETDENVEQGTILEGNEKQILGKRRGEPFAYKLFITKEGKIIYLKNITPMETTEVTLGADGSVSPTKINLLPAETFNKVKTMGLVIGGIAGFAYSKYKKIDNKKMAMYIGLGAVVGYFAGYVVDRNRKATVTPSK